MMNKLITILFICGCFTLCSNHAIANESNGCNGYKGKLLNACDPHHEHKAPRGLGANILIHETELADFIGEYKYDGENKEHSIFFVVENKKSVVDYIKDLINKVKGE